MDNAADSVAWLKSWLALEPLSEEARAQHGEVLDEWRKRGCVAHEWKEIIEGVAKRRRGG